MDRMQCPLCGGTGPCRIVGAYQVVVCPVCDYGFVHPPAKQGTIGRYLWRGGGDLFHGEIAVHPPGVFQLARRRIIKCVLP